MNVDGRWRTIAAMSPELETRRSYPLAIIMQCKTVGTRWVTEQWEAQGVVHDTTVGGPRVIVEREGLRQILFPGFELRLHPEEAEGYYLNLTSPEPKVFVLWRGEDGDARPHRITVSYGEGTRWADSGEQVDGVALPLDLVPWIARFVEAHYRPEPPKKKRYASNKDRGRMGHIE